MQLQEGRRESPRLVLHRGDMGDTKVVMLYVSGGFITVHVPEEDVPVVQSLHVNLFTSKRALWLS